jgi:hypothetical protein
MVKRQVPPLITKVSTPLFVQICVDIGEQTSFNFCKSLAGRKISHRM